MTAFSRCCALGLSGIVLLAGCAGATAVAPEGTSQPATLAAISVTPAVSTDQPSPGPTLTSTTERTAPATDSAPAETSVPVQATVSPTPTIACTPEQLTPAETEGPYYKANPPESTSLLQPGMAGTKLTITGYVLNAECQPVPGARVDFWQADSEGQYDNQGYTLRGYQVTDAQGRYSVDTVVPGLYPGRTRHIHVKVTAPGGPTLTTQLYFPDEPANGSDQIYDPRMLLRIEPTSTGETARFDFVIGT
jgi:protocatechuate 3,4-dioxygenase beta subunit